MQLMNPSFADQFGSSVVEAIREPEKWGDVLDQIIATTPACAAIITLREKKTCQIVNDRDLEANYHSPLIRGFSEEAVGYYLMELREIDPWAEFQKSFYPFRPMLMSAAKPPEADPGNRFFQWLQGLNMHDSVVFELDRMAGYWSAFNLFLPSRDVSDARELMEFVNRNFDFLRNAWQTSQKFEQSRQTEKVLLRHMDEIGQPCCLVGPNGELSQNNAGFESLLSKGHVRLSGPHNKISFGRDVELIGLDAWEDHAVTRHECSAEPIKAIAKPIEPDPRFSGKRETPWVLVFYGLDHSESPSVDHADKLMLSKQECSLHEAVAQGQSVEEAGLAIGVKRSRAFEIWKSVKGKLNINSSHEVRRRPKSLVHGAD